MYLDQNKVEFGDEELRRRSLPTYNPKTPKMVDWVVKHSGGYIKDEKQANFALLVFAIIAIVISLFLFFGGGRKSSPNGFRPAGYNNIPGETSSIPK